MVYLKKANLIDIEEEYHIITTTPLNENGFVNPHCGCSYDEFKNDILINYINHSLGINLKDGYVPSTYFFLWDDDKIVGLFKVRHYLTPALANGAGHIGFAIKKEFRGRTYATKGLIILLSKIKNIIKEDEIYMSCQKDNLASLKVQLNVGAYIHHQDENMIYTRIKK